MNRPPDTVITCLTPAGTGAIATLGLHGPQAWELTRALFAPGLGQGGKRRSLPDSVEPGQTWLGRLGAEMTDQVVLALKTLTPVPLLEIHCHGGREMLLFLSELYEKQGVRRCSREEWLQRTQGSPVQAAALQALSQALTVRTAAILLEQYHGALECALRQLAHHLEANDMNAATAQLAELRRHARLGQHLTQPWRVVLAGPPNVGKSSLINALAGYQRSVVAATPGTTRDVVTTLLALEGWPVELADTAGQHGTVEALEAAGVERARTAVTAADLSLWVVEASAPPVWPTSSPSNLRLVINKIDQPPVWNLDAVPHAWRVAARTGAGVAELGQALANALVTDPPSPGAPIPFTAAQQAVLDELAALLPTQGCLVARQRLRALV